MPKPGIMYVPSHVNLGTHPKTRKLARRLGVDIVTTVGHLHFLWWWGMTFAPDGQLHQYTAEDIAIAAEWAGDCETFHASLQAAGFITDNALHDWNEYGGRLLIERERNAKYQQDHRDRSVRKDDVRLTKEPRKSYPYRREEKSKEEKKEGIPSVSSSPKHKYSAEFEAFWTEYPNKAGKQDAWIKWQQIEQSDVPEVVSGLRKWKESERWREGFIMAGERWLGKRFWADEPPPGKSANGRHTNGRVSFGDLARKQEREIIDVEGTVL